MKRTVAIGLILSALVIGAAYLDKPVETEPEYIEPVAAYTVEFLPAAVIAPVEPVEEAYYQAPDPATLEVVTVAESAVFTISAYCACGICNGKWTGLPTASGTEMVEGRTVGTDWGVLPAGTVIEIEGIGQRVVEDKVAGWISDRYDGMIIDLFVGDHETAKEFGVRKAEVIW